MADGMFNISRGKVAYYGGLPAAADALVLVVLEAVEADDVLNNYDDLATLLGAAGNVEATSTNYVRKTLSSGVTVTVDDAANTTKAIIDADQTWTSVSQAGSETWTKLLVCYDDNTGTGTDANIVPMTHHDTRISGSPVIPNGGDITADFDQTNGFWSSS